VAQPEANNRFGIRGVRSIIITFEAVAATAALITAARNLRRVRNIDRLGYLLIRSRQRQFRRVHLL